MPVTYYYTYIRTDANGERTIEVNQVAPEDIINTDYTYTLVYSTTDLHELQDRTETKIAVLNGIDEVWYEFPGYSTVFRLSDQV